MIDKRPAIILRVADVADVMSAVNYARENGLDLAIRGGGRNGHGLGSVDNGLVVDCRLRDVRVDTATNTVRVGAGVCGATWATQPTPSAWPSRAASSPTRCRRPDAGRRHRLSHAALWPDH
ncbi:MAG: FAD-binding protein [Anaerolineae bacterium]